jgi:hypothetical protein
MRTTVLMVMSLFIAGCVNFDVRGMVPNESVKPVQTGYDCAYVWPIPPLLIGTISATQAMANAGHREETAPGFEPKFVHTPITKVHSIESQQRAFLLYNEICIQVTGE